MAPLLIYGAIILSFMGGIRWGAAMLRDDASFNALGRSVLPSLLALAAAALGGALGLVLIALGFCGLLVYDESEVVLRPAALDPKSFRPLTGIVVACLRRRLCRSPISVLLIEVLKRGHFREFTTIPPLTAMRECICAAAIAGRRRPPGKGDGEV